jgi:tetratricopeptide (TPR) repeat protein
MSTPSAPAAVTVPRSSRNRLRWLFLLPLGYSIFVVAIFGFAWRAVDAAPAPPKPPGTEAAAGKAGPVQQGADLAALKAQLDLDEQKLALEQDYLDKRATQLDKRADDLERLITEMTLGSSIYTFLLGLFAYFGLKTIKADAQADLTKIEDLLDDFKKNEFPNFKNEIEERTRRAVEQAQTEFDSFRAEVRNDIPEMYGMARSLGVILDRIRRQVDVSRNWTYREAYEAMTEEERQTVLVAEMTVGGFDYFGLPSSKRYRTAAGEIYLNLANFYAARSRTVGADGRYNQADMRRALIYIDRACSSDVKNPRVFSQRAAILLIDIPKPGDAPTKEQLESAAADLKECLKLKPTDARALYNQAWIARRQGKLPEAIEYLTKIIDQRQTLPPDDRGRRIVDAFTNRACYRALLLNPLPPDAARQPAIKSEADGILMDCQGACDEAKLYKLHEYCRKGFTREFAANGDLAAVRPLLGTQEVDAVITCA